MGNLARTIFFFPPTAADGNNTRQLLYQIETIKNDVLRSIFFPFIIIFFFKFINYTRLSFHKRSNAVLVNRARWRRVGDDIAPPRTCGIDLQTWSGNVLRQICLQHTDNMYGYIYIILFINNIYTGKLLYGEGMWKYIYIYTKSANDAQKLMQQKLKYVFYSVRDCTRVKDNNICITVYVDGYQPCTHIRSVTFDKYRETERSPRFRKRAKTKR